MGNYIPHRPHDNRIISHFTNLLLPLFVWVCVGEHEHQCAHLLERCMFRLSLERPLADFHMMGFSCRGGELGLKKGDGETHCVPSGHHREWIWSTVIVWWNAAEHAVLAAALLTNKAASRCNRDFIRGACVWVTSTIMLLFPQAPMFIKHLCRSISVMWSMTRHPHASQPLAG